MLFRSQDTDYATVPQRYRAALTDAMNQSAGSIATASQRADFLGTMSRFTEFGTNMMTRESAARAKNAGRANLDDAVTGAVNDALRTPDDLTKSLALGAMGDRITAARDAGIITPSEALNLKKSAVQTYAARRATMMADADPAAAVKALQPTGLSTDGTPTFDKTGDWRDMLDPGKRMDIVRLATQHAQTLAQAGEVQAMRQERLQIKSEQDAANKAADGYVTQLAKDPTQVDPIAIAQDNRFAPSQWHVKEGLINMARGAVQKDTDKDTKTYGPGFYDLYQQIHAPDGTPDKITDPSQLYQHAGPDGDLTIAGVDRLTQEIQGKRASPEGEAASKMTAGALAYAKHQLSFEADYGLYKIRDPHGEDIFNTGFLPAFYQAYDAGIKAGKTPAQLLSKDSPDFIVDKVIAPYKRTPPQELKDHLDADMELSAKDKAAAGQTPHVKLPNAGDMMDGYRFKGGDPAQQANWEAVPSAPIAR